MIHNYINTVCFATMLLVANTAVTAVAADRARGLTQGFFTEGFHPDGQTVFIQTEFTEIQVFQSLPPGRYIANASAVILNEDTEPRFVECIFTVGEFLLGDLASGTVGPGTTISLPLTIGFRNQESQDLGVACRADVAGRPVSAQGTPLTAIRVNRLETQP